MKSISLSIEQEAQLRGELKQNENVTAYRRAAALLAVHQGRAVGEVAQLLGVTRQTVYNWVSEYGQNERKFDLNDAPRTGRPTVWTRESSVFLEQTLRQPPGALGYPAPHWNARLLLDHVTAHGLKAISEETLRRRLRQLGYVWKEDRYVPRPEVLDGRPLLDAAPLPEPVSLVQDAAVAA